MTTNEEHKPFVGRGSGNYEDDSQSADDTEKTKRTNERLFNQIYESIPAKDDVVQPRSINRRRTPNSLTSWTPTKLPKNLQHVHQTDLKLTAHLHDFWILPSV
ncbi:hypothetical protein LSH36_207g03011 [Paralvinella palmiformis]|uniref:Uncharacterized protein n=1 Tax=Paralvinella palmiformis TaxID=53620 RepID=A0AAD9JP77_9ANNE|nr:hypothetical protein LSH36_207g03011 [Paralvinella palmiformis]